jgi:hypothetical protein
MKLNQTLAATLIAAAAIVTAQCGGDTKSSSGLLSLPSSASAVASDSAISTRAVGDITNSAPELGKLKVCKIGPNATFDVSGGSAEVSILANAAVASGTCVVVAQDSNAPGVSPASAGAQVTVTENPAANLASISMQRNDAGAISDGTFANGGSLFLNDFHGFTITFTNDEPEPPPPPTGTEGCTPGFWKNKPAAWTTYAPGDDFDTTFGVNFFNPDITLGTAVNLGGGGVSALARHAVAAILNVANPDVDYSLTLAQVLDIVQGDGDYAGLSVEARKNLLVTANELGCPL